MVRACALSLVAVLAVAPTAGGGRAGQSPSRSVRDLVADLGASDAMARARAACELRESGDGAAEAIGPLVALLSDAAPVESSVCGRRWWRGEANDLTSPGEQAAAALVAVGTRAFQPVLGAMRSATWAARRNAAWTLGALDDERAVPALVEALKDREPGVREQAA
jgi:HEAT repeat protein